jgi:hypothetical protein
LAIGKQKKEEKIKESCHILVTSWKLLSRYGNFIIFAGKKKVQSNFWLVKKNSNSLPDKWSNYLFIGNHQFRPKDA